MFFLIFSLYSLTFPEFHPYIQQNTPKQTGNNSCTLLSNRKNLYKKARKMRKNKKLKLVLYLFQGWTI